MAFQITCAGPGPHIPANGVIGASSKPVTEAMYCGSAACQAAAMPAPTPQQANTATLQVRLQNALDANVAYRAIGSPTNAQMVAQVDRLTQECSALIRLLLGQLDSTS